MDDYDSEHHLLLRRTRQRVGEFYENIASSSTSWISDISKLIVNSLESNALPDKEKLPKEMSYLGISVDNNGSRIDDEISLLQAMYPEQIEWESQTREIRVSLWYTHGIIDQTTTSTKTKAQLTLRLPDDYLNDESNTKTSPTIISATGPMKQDLRTTVTNRWQLLNLSAGEEVLDQIIADFQDLADSLNDAQVQTLNSSSDNILKEDHPRNTCKTVVIWLHHLLATGKRKLALNPSQSPAQSSSFQWQRVSGITKPGYPGIMVFTGPTDMVDTHVAELKSQRWQAFQVRFEAEYDMGREWGFEHGKGIKEVESMSEVVSDIQQETHRGEFLSAVGVK